MVSLGKDHGPRRSPFIPPSLLQDYAQVKLCFKPKAFSCLDKTELFLNSVVKKTDSGTNCLSLLNASKSILSWLCLPPSGLTFPQAEHSGFWPCYTPVSQLLPLFLGALALILAPSARNMLSSVFLPTSPSRLILAASPYKFSPDPPIWVPGLLRQTYCTRVFQHQRLHRASYHHYGSMCPCHPQASWGQGLHVIYLCLSQPTLYLVFNQHLLREHMNK